MDPVIQHASAADGARRRSRVTVVVDDGLRPADVVELVDRLREILETAEVELVVCDVGAILRPDAGTVDALARLQLMAGRLSRRIAFDNAAPRVQELLDLMGLADVLLQLEPPASAGNDQGTMPSSSNDSSNSSGSR